MKRKMYTYSHDIELLKKIDNDGGRFTAEEHAYIQEEERNETIFKTRESLLSELFAGSFKERLDSIAFVINYIKQNKYRNIISLGAGYCIKEYLLNMALPENSQVVACDFDAFFIKKAQEFFIDDGKVGKGIIPVQFDFFNDNFQDLKNDLKLDFDVAIFFSSAYVMDDNEFIKLFSDLKNAGISCIIDFHAGYMDWKEILRYYLKPLSKNIFIRKVFRKPIRPYQGKFHGYSRSRNEIRKLYKKSGLVIDREFSVGGYKYVSILS